MQSFPLPIIDRTTALPEILQISHSADLSNRKGYNPDFLSINVPLPKIAADTASDLAVVQKDFGVNGKSILDYTHFSVAFLKTKKLPLFTAVNIDGSTDLMGLPHESRASDIWNADDRIEIDGDSFQYGNADYLHSGFQRGHMVRYFDPAWGNDDDLKKLAMADTFHYTNCCPQIPYYNSVVWNYLEDYYMARAIFQDGLMTIFSGPIFNKAKTINGLLVPLNFWKVVVYRSGKNAIQAMGFIMSHERYFNRLEEEKMLIAGKVVEPTLTKESIAKLYEKKELIDAKVKIALIEEKTGLSFGLGDVDEKKEDDIYAVDWIKPENTNKMNLEYYQGIEISTLSNDALNTLFKNI